VGTNVVFAARGRVLDETFRLSVDRAALGRYPRSKLEDRVLEEAASLIREAEQQESFDWEANHFTHDHAFGTWEKVLSAEELDRLMSS